MTVVVERTLGHLGEDLLHDVRPVVLLQVGQQFRAVIIEIVIEEMIHEEHLTDHVDQIEELTEDELGGVEIVCANRIGKVVNHRDPIIISFHKCIYK